MRKLRDKEQKRQNKFSIKEIDFEEYVVLGIKVDKDIKYVVKGWKNMQIFEIFEIIYR